MAVRNNYKLIAKGYELLEETPDKSKAITWAVLLDKEQKKIAFHILEILHKITD